MSFQLTTFKSIVIFTVLTLFNSCQPVEQPVETTKELKDILLQLQRKGACNEVIDLADVQLSLDLKDEDRIYYLILKGQCNRMKEAYQKSEKVFRQVINYDPLKYPEIAKAYYGLGDLNYIKWAYFEQENQLDTALVYLEKAREIAETSNNYSLLSQCLYRLGTIDQIQDNDEVAMEKFNEANQLAYSVRDTAGIIRNSTHKAVGFQRAGNLDSAEFYYKQSLKLASAANIYYSESHSLGNLGEFYQDQGQLDLALKYYNNALFLSEKLDQSLLLCKSNLLLGFYYKEIGKNEEALKYFSDGQVIAEKIGYKNFIAYFERVLTELEN